MMWLKVYIRTTWLYIIVDIKSDREWWEFHGKAADTGSAFNRGITYVNGIRGIGLSLRQNCEKTTPFQVSVVSQISKVVTISTKQIPPKIVIE